MAGYHRPPVRGLKVVCALFGATAFGSTGLRHGGQPGLLLGLGVGAVVGWIAGWWIARELFD